MFSSGACKAGKISRHRSEISLTTAAIQADSGLSPKKAILIEHGMPELGPCERKEAVFPMLRIPGLAPLHSW